MESNLGQWTKFTTQTVVGEGRFVEFLVSLHFIDKSWHTTGRTLENSLSSILLQIQRTFNPRMSLIFPFAHAVIVCQLFIIFISANLFLAVKSRLINSIQDEDEGLRW